MVKVRIKRKRSAIKLSLPSGPTSVKVGLPSEGTDPEVIKYGTYNHFGTSGGGWGGAIPERPFISNAIRDNRSNYYSMMKKAAKGVLTNKGSMHSALAKLGQAAEDDIKKEIRDLRNPANSPVTIEKKGSSNPLIDTGKMRQSIKWKIND